MNSNIKNMVDDIWGEEDKKLQDNLNGQILKECGEVNIEQMREAMEQNEDEVECRKCFELANKADCEFVPELHGYVCKACRELKEDKNSDEIKIIDLDELGIMLSEDMDPEEVEVENVEVVAKQPEECADGKCCCGKDGCECDCEKAILAEPVDPEVIAAECEHPEDDKPIQVDFTLDDLVSEEPENKMIPEQEPIVQDPQAKADYVRQLAVEDDARGMSYDPFDLVIFVADCKNAGFDANEDDFNQYFEALAELSHK